MTFAGFVSALRNRFYNFFCDIAKKYFVIFYQKICCRSADSML